MKIGYARISTREQNLDMHAQIVALNKELEYIQTILNNNAGVRKKV